MRMSSIKQPMKIKTKPTSCVGDSGVDCRIKTERVVNKPGSGVVFVDAP